MNAEHPNGLSLRGIDKRFGTVRALSGVDLKVREGEFFTLLGPSGCGKTTLLRIVAGLEHPDAGRVLLGGRDITALPATRRPVNTVFQSYALFPHLSVYENVAFGLRSRRLPAAEVDRKVPPLLAMLGLEGKKGRLPHQLSGGEMQRVALARALVNEPRVLLLDEPMSALDARLRSQVQEELRRLQRALGRTFILVTHDQAEALAVSDRIAVMDHGAIVQHGTPREVYERPKNRYVAEFLGAANLIAARVRNGGVETAFGFLALPVAPGWSEGHVAIRPERIRLAGDPAAENAVRARVREVVYRGAETDLWLEPGPLRVRTSALARFEPGEALWLELPGEHLVAMNDDE